MQVVAAPSHPSDGIDTKLVCFDTSIVDLTEMLLALSDEGRAWHDERTASAFAALGAPVFACTPDRFPDLMAAALRRQDIAAWAAERDIALARACLGSCHAKSFRAGRPVFPPLSALTATSQKILARENTVGSGSDRN
jgi:hypothetical protein